MTRVSTRNAPSCIAARRPFRTSGALRGEWRGEAYAVVSYSTTIALWQGGVWEVASRKYSCTTSRHQTAVALGARGEIKSVYDFR
jgi:hypothetical protein